MSRARPAEVVRAFGRRSDRIWRIGARNNIHWRVASGAERYVLRRFGEDPAGRASALWEHALVEDLADAGWPVPRAVAPPREIDGALWLLMHALPGRVMARGAVGPEGYRRMGHDLAQLHEALERLPARAQRPGWGEFVEAVMPLSGGPARRAVLLADLEAASPEAARAFRTALEGVERRDIPAVFAGAARGAVHGDISPWNLRYRGGALCAVLDFELAHVDVLAADLALARRGYHDAVVDGYLERRPLPEAQVAALDALWLGGIFHGLWRALEHRRGAGPLDLDWSLQQLAKTRPYRPAAVRRRKES